MFVRRVGKYIRKARKQCGMTMEEAAFQAGISYETLSRIERSETDTYHATINRLILALKIDVQDFHASINDGHNNFDEQLDR